MNNSLKELLNLANQDGAIKNTEKSKQNIYQSKYFEGASEDEEKTIRRKLRSIAINYLSLLAGAKDKKSFDIEYKKFEKFFKQTYTTEKVDFSVFESFRKDSAKKTLQGAIANCEKYNK